MEPRRFDRLAQSLATARTRRGLLGGIVAFAASVRAASATLDCPPGQSRNRKGECRCPPGTDACPGGCFDKLHDLDNCGSCGNLCPSGATCTKGTCRCPYGTEVCRDQCTDPALYQYDSFNCGGCGNECNSDEFCQNGSCVFQGTCVGFQQPCEPGVDVCCNSSFCNTWGDCQGGAAYCC